MMMMCMMIIQFYLLPRFKPKSPPCQSYIYLLPFTMHAFLGNLNASFMPHQRAKPELYLCHSSPLALYQTPLGFCSPFLSFSSSSSCFIPFLLGERATLSCPFNHLNLDPLVIYPMAESQAPLYSQSCSRHIHCGLQYHMDAQIE